LLRSVLARQAIATIKVKGDHGFTRGTLELGLCRIARNEEFKAESDGTSGRVRAETSES